MVRLRDVVAGIGVLLLVVAVALGLTWLFQGNEFFLYKVFAPKAEAVRRETFEQSKAFNQGMVQELQSMRFQYVQAEQSHKDALASVILHRVADFDTSKLPADLRSFIEDLQRDRLQAK